MTKKLSLIACGLILSTSSVFAESSLEAAFASGQASGDISLYHFKQNNKTGNDAGFTAGTVGVSYETGTFHDFNAKASFRAGHKFAEETENVDYVGEFKEDSVMNEASITYAVESFSLTLGRQEIDLEWIGDFNEAAVLSTNVIPNTELVLAYAGGRQAVAGADEISNFDEVTKDGAYVLDAKIGIVEGLEINPYYYDVVDVASVYGIKAGYSNDMFGLLGHYAATNEDVVGTEDGDIAQVELAVNVSAVSLSAGYIVTDKTGAVGSMAAYGDNINPLDEGDKVYGTDAKTTYASIGGEISGIELGAIYGSTKYLNGVAKEKETELNFTVAMEVVKNTSVELLYVDVDAEGSASDWDKIAATVTYSF